MAEIFKSQTFDLPVNRCFENLVTILPQMEITIQSHSTESHAIIGYWTYGAARYIIEAECIIINENTTDVRINYRPELISALKRPYINSPTVQAIIRQKMSLILARLAQSLGITKQDNPDVAVKFKRTTQKWQWFDWVIFFAIGLPLLILTHLSQRSSGIGFCLDFGFGIGWWALYSLTLRRLWTHLFPQLYTEWACANCKKKQCQL